MIINESNLFLKKGYYFLYLILNKLYFLIILIFYYYKYKYSYKKYIYFFKTMEVRNTFPCGMEFKSILLRHFGCHI